MRREKHNVSDRSEQKSGFPSQRRRRCQIYGPKQEADEILGWCLGLIRSGVECSWSVLTPCRVCLAAEGVAVRHLTQLWTLCYLSHRANFTQKTRKMCMIWGHFRFLALYFDFGDCCWTWAIITMVKCNSALIFPVWHKQNDVNQNSCALASFSLTDWGGMYLWPQIVLWW